ncbi:hypothetical protein PRELSG_0022700 [Plasmodium relictum]|uniref:Gametocyte associated protein n=1 Tax=Plasmodium relictum TaxID=85471 RepID=A0A1J1GK30_PLARL|nr:hypothetical protein PRELSG_0022700 [Plasmodium relictum]CRG84542.1 hypothetical protein PRELSG_0022700 [Plasmodium relictum]
MKSSIFNFFNWLFFMNLSIIILLNINLFSNVTRIAPTKEYELLWKGIERSLAEGECSSVGAKLNVNQYSNSDTIERFNTICDIVHSAYLDTLLWLKDPAFNNYGLSYNNNGLKIGDIIQAHLSNAGFTFSYRLIRNEIIRVKERNALIILLRRTDKIIEQAKEIFTMENDLTKILLESIVDKNQAYIKNILTNEYNIIDSIERELKKRNFKLPELHIKRMMFRIIRRAHDIALELGVLHEFIPPPPDCYVREFTE